QPAVPGAADWRGPTRRAGRPRSQPPGAVSPRAGTRASSGAGRSSRALFTGRMIPGEPVSGDEGMKRIGVLTGGGDAPGLNPAIKAVVYRASEAGIGTIGIPGRRGGPLDQGPGG